MNDADLALLRTRIEQAKHQISTAEQELEDALRELRAGDRADKVHVGERIERAFKTLGGAKEDLLALEATLLSDRGTP